MNQQLFLYGSLRSGFRHPAYSYISDNFSLLGPARTRGELYDLGDYPAAIPSGGEDYIQGELYQLKPDKDFAWVMEQIDDYEGLHVEAGETPLYRREMASVEISGKNTEAWVYWYNQGISGFPRVVSGDVLEYLESKKNQT
jgi:gamma-glutamylcyclotransferase (GGCT)/AIG2-like uncharacterized protein YtfP